MYIRTNVETGYCSEIGCLNYDKGELPWGPLPFYRKWEPRIFLLTPGLEYAKSCVGYPYYFYNYSSVCCVFSNISIYTLCDWVLVLVFGQRITLFASPVGYISNLRRDSWWKPRGRMRKPFWSLRISWLIFLAQMVKCNLLIYCFVDSTLWLGSHSNGILVNLIRVCWVIGHPGGMAVGQVILVGTQLGVARSLAGVFWDDVTQGVTGTQA